MGSRRGWLLPSARNRAHANRKAALARALHEGGDVPQNLLAQTGLAREHVGHAHDHLSLTDAGDIDQSALIYGRAGPLGLGALHSL